MRSYALNIGFSLKNKTSHRNTHKFHSPKFTMVFNPLFTKSAKCLDNILNIKYFAIWRNINKQGSLAFMYSYFLWSYIKKE